MKRWTVLIGGPHEVGRQLDKLEQETERLEVVSATTAVGAEGQVYLTVMVSYWEEAEE